MGHPNGIGVVTRPMTPAPKPRVVKKARQPLRAKKRMKRFNAKRGGHKFPALVDESRRAFVRTFPCCACAVEFFGGQHSMTQACHLKSRGAGGADAENLFPACVRHHIEQHTIGVASFQKKYRLNLARVCERIERAYVARGGAGPEQETT